MFLISLVNFIFSVISGLLTTYIFIVIISCVLSFVNLDPYNRLVVMIRQLTEPAFRFVRRKLPFVVINGLDFSPLVLVIGISFVQRVLLSWVNFKLLTLLA